MTNIEDGQRLYMASERIEKGAYRVDWGDLNAPLRPLTPTTPWRYIGSTQTVQGCLIGGCIDLFPFMNGTSLWPGIEEWEDTILFLETSEDMPTPTAVLYTMRNLGAQGILQKLKGILFARPGGEFLPTEVLQKEEHLKNYLNYDNVLVQACKEFNVDIPIVTHMDFGHTVPQAILPYGIKVEINPQQKTVSLLESAVI